MIRKCIKHEFMASYRNYLPVYAALYILSLMIYFSFQVNSEILGSLLIMLFSLVFGALAIFIIYNLIISLGTRVYGKPGYLLFSIPAKTHEIMISKFIVNFVWIIASAFVAISASAIAFSVLGVFEEVKAVFELLFQELGIDAYGAILIGLYAVIYAIYFIAFFMFLFALLNVIYKGERKILYGILLYFGLNFITGMVINAISMPIFSSLLMGQAYDPSYIWIFLIIYFVLSVAFILLTYHILNKKLELQ